MMPAKPIFAKDRIILALDFDSLEEAEKYVIMLKDYVGYFKIGLPLFVSCGFKAVEIVKKHGGKVFFDCKFNDIPNVVAKASAKLIKNGVDFFDIHSIGGSKMMSTTVKLCTETAKKNNLEKPTIIAATLLSSFGQRTLSQELGVSENLAEYVEHLTKIAKDSGLDGVLASASEAVKIRKTFGEDFIIICPAVRPSWSVVNDQIRVVTPTDAINAGVDYMIIGRPVTSHDDPVAAVKLITAEIKEAELKKSADAQQF